MKRLFLFSLLFALISLAFCQVPSVSFIDNPLGANEGAPTLYPAADGGFFITHPLSKSSPDSIFASLTRLNSSLAVQWNRVFKMKANTTISAVEEATDGSLSVLVNGYNTASRYYPVLSKLTANGLVTQSIEVIDSSSNTQTGPFLRMMNLQNGNRILFGSSSATVIRLNALGKVDYAKQLTYKNQGNQVLYLLGGKVVPGTNQWLAHGNISNTNLTFLLKMEDTTLVFLHVYDFKPLASSFGINNLHIFPNLDMVGAHVDNSQRLHIYRLNSTGGFIWRKCYKLPLTYPGKLTVDSGGDIWMSGSMTPGQAGGLLMHFSPTGTLLGHRTQNQGGVSLGNMQGFSELPNNEFLTLQRGFYNSSSALIVNRIHSSMDFKCFNSNQYNFIDTTYAIVDSATTLISSINKRFGVTSTLSFPLQVFSPSVSSGLVVCTPNATAEMLTPEPYLLVPNPAKETLHIDGLEQNQFIRVFNSEGRLMLEERYSGSISVGKLPTGLYWLEVAEKGIRKRFAKE